MSNNDDRPKPPRPTPPSDPTIRSARAPSDPSIRAAGLTRPGSQPDFVANEVKRHGQVLANHEGRIETLEGATDGAAGHAGDVTEHLSDQDTVLILVARELGLQDKLPDRYRRSIPPPPPNAAPPKQAMVPKIEADSMKAKVAIYALIVFTVLKVFMDVFHIGAK